MVFGKEFYHVSVRAENVLALVKDSQISFELGTISQFLSVDCSALREGGYTRRDGPGDMWVPDH